MKGDMSILDLVVHPTKGDEHCLTRTAIRKEFCPVQAICTIPRNIARGFDMVRVTSGVCDNSHGIHSVHNHLNIYNFR